MCSIKCCFLLRRLRRPRIHCFSTAGASTTLPRKNYAGDPLCGAGPPPAPGTGDAARAHEAAVRRLAAAGDVDGVQLALQEMRLRGVPCTEGALVAAVGAFARAGAPDRALKTFYRAVHDLGCARPTEPRLYNHLIDALLRENMGAVPEQPGRGRAQNARRNGQEGVSPGRRDVCHHCLSAVQA
ncbi:Pentatricopeptide repeat-containing protein At3g48810 isoform 2 [Zea mays]|uniref:Pentatricopeptide repeat-containing protein n=2 Tax=Zea mays TaxID=4577 RepID=B4G0V0_MAIZE|nr:Pentatricopeptide repeat-containing protein At3g48810 isoform 2 [Zea mays]ACF87993.1 unknown [Zea mays]|eukprot:NP_001142248.1 uncharacterized protein LOC100274417 isoform 2 [Zea mays]